MDVSPDEYKENDTEKQDERLEYNERPQARFELAADEAEWTERHSRRLAALSRKLLTWGVESRGIFPVSKKDRKDRDFHKIFFVWFAMNFNILSFSTGTVGPVVYGLSLRDTCLIILFFNILCCAPPAYFATWGPKLGLRQMCQSRYSFGYYGVIVPSIFNLVTMMGFMILNCILGGQTLAAVSDGNLSWTVGIVVIAIISLLVSFSGYRVLNWYERVSWIPVLIVYLVALGIGGKHLSSPPPAEPATAGTVLSFASVIAGFVLTYSPLSSDFTIYYDSAVSGWRIFIYSYLGFLLPIVTIQCLGAAFGIAASSVPSWSAAYASGSVGDLIAAVLSPSGGFGKFLTVLLSLSVTANIAPTMYSFGMSFQVFVPYSAVLPRYVFSILATAVVIPISIVGAHRFYTTLTNFLGLIGYWASCFIAVIFIEHVVFRAHAASLFPDGQPPPPISGKADVLNTPPTRSFYSENAFENYDISAWNVPSRLPSGVPAIAASLLSFGLVIPSMDQVWFVGPIAKTTGDIGFELALVVTALLYIPLRFAEIKLRKRL